MLERTLGRLLRSPDPHPPADPPADSPPSDPPADPPADLSLISGDPPADPPAEPKDPPADPPPVVEPLKVEDFVLPENFELPEELGKELLEIFNGETEPKDKANALIALHAKTVSEALEADSQAWNKMQTEWRDEAKADTQIGGEKLQPALTNIGKLIDEFGTDELRGVFDLTGAGNNVHVIKFLSTIADKLTEGNFFKASSPSASNAPDAAAKRMFPSASDANN